MAVPADDQGVVAVTRWDACGCVWRLPSCVVPLPCLASHGPSLSVICLTRQGTAEAELGWGKDPRKTQDAASGATTNVALAARSNRAATRTTAGIHGDCGPHTDAGASTNGIRYAGSAAP
jgi:hypothetical protein